jgi:NRAMP (natural resistance-associated macrophage protein)-like metal ion transporter
VLAEVAIIATDLAELLGSAIALCLLFPKLPMWAGVVITALDVFIILGFRDPLGSRPVRLFELFIAIMVRIFFLFSFFWSRFVDVSGTGSRCNGLHGTHNNEAFYQLGDGI